jgi:hypothetical protein
MKIAFRSSAADGRWTKNATKMPTVRPASPTDGSDRFTEGRRGQPLHERRDDRADAEDHHRDVADEDHAIGTAQVVGRARQRLHVLVQDGRSERAQLLRRIA